MTEPQALFDALKAELGEGLLACEGAGDDTVFRATPASAHDALRLLRDRHGFNVLVDLTAMDRLKLAEPEPRFELTWRLMALDAASGLVAGRIAVKARLAEGEAGRSVMDLWPAADWLEREVWDMFGIAWKDRPGIKRLLMYESFVGHPLRKDYAIHKRQPLIGPASGERPDNPSFNAQVPTVTAD